MKQSLKYLLLSLGVISLGFVSYFGYTLWRILNIGTAYQAKQFCSGVFVSGRSKESVFDRDVLAEIEGLSALEKSIVKSIQVKINRSQQSATANIFGWAKHQAIFRPGLGCTLVIDTTEARLRSQVKSLPLVPQKLNERRSLRQVDSVPPEINQRQLKLALDSVFRPQQHTRAVVIVYQGQIVAERYAPGFSAQMPLPGWSMTKSVTNALVGILVKEDKLSLKDKNLMPEWSDRRSQITLDSMLHMSSGLTFNEDEGSPLGDLIQMLFGRANTAGYAANQPLAATPNTKWQYSSGTTNIISRVIRNAIASDADYLTFPRRALFNRLEMQSAVIEPDASGTFVGSSFMYATARDWARFGLLYLQDGVWEGQRILPEGWVKYSRTLAELAPQKNYGAHFWLMNVAASSEQNQILTAQGFQDQYIAIIPSHQLVIVHLGKNEQATRQQFIPQILAAFTN
ncbi:serine hydrolase domain-containing protein [Aliterella atlantica]|uniref:Penicillin-binding protein, beta-lactamase class C n=1 Tax=Aliterella atlantica CENA595 TaxID=1618023 RepID=A0A0D8ZT94_9CYAN|nr:serine hydrolase [Aliterella atlantica]KJH71988.1 penicillin-binding protein, beta-lactamase class C [Aliterella atlantica CENA595]